MKTYLLKRDLFEENDEYYTPKFVIEPLIPFIKKFKRVWCPFDTNNSNFISVLKDNGFEVINTSRELDFFTNAIDCDVIISNPPFSLKLNVLQRLYDLKKPFAFLLPMTILNYNEINKFFLDKRLELIIYDKKVSFNGKTSSFNTSWFCNGINENQITFLEISKNGSSKKYEVKK